MSSFLFSSYLLHFNCKFVAQKNAPAKLAGTFFFYWLTALTLRNGRKDVTCHVQPCSP